MIYHQQGYLQKIILLHKDADHGEDRDFFLIQFKVTCFFFIQKKVNFCINPPLTPDVLRFNEEVIIFAKIINEFMIVITKFLKLLTRI